MILDNFNSFKLIATSVAVSQFLIVWGNGVSAQSWSEPDDVFDPQPGRAAINTSFESIDMQTPLARECDPFCDPHGHQEFVLLPEGFIYPTYLGNPHEPRLGAQIVNESKDGVFFDATVGGRVGLIRWGPTDRPEGVQLDVLAGGKLRLDPEEEMDVRAVDFRVDIPFTWEDGPHRYKFGYSHISSHLGDEFLLKNPGFDRLNYYRDAIMLGYSYYLRPDIRLYGEATYSFWRAHARPWRLTFGVDYAPAIPTGNRGVPFLALNGDLREEVDFGGAFAAQAGWAWRSAYNPGILRTGLYYYNGKSPQFSFFNDFEQQIGWGLWYDF